MADTIRKGPVFLLAGIIGGLTLTFAVVFLGIASFEVVGPTFVIGWMGGLVAVTASSTKKGFAFSKGGSLVWITGLAGVIGIILDSWLVRAFLPVPPLSFGVSGVLLINVLFAIYEETFFLGVRCAGKAANLPDIYVVLLEVAAFVPYHGLRYDLVSTLFYIVFLAGARLILSAISLMTDHSDPPYIAHIIYNALATIFGV